jgi:hypothetical protein
MLFAPLARMRHALAGAVARLLAWWPRRGQAHGHRKDETRRVRSAQPTRQLRALSANSATPRVTNLVPRPGSLATEVRALATVRAPRHHRIERIGAPNVRNVTVECECGWVVTTERVADALSTFALHAATATGHPRREELMGEDRDDLMRRETMAVVMAQSRAYADVRMPIKAPADRLEGVIATAYSCGWLWAEVAETQGHRDRQLSLEHQLAPCEEVRARALAYAAKRIQLVDFAISDDVCASMSDGFLHGALDQQRSARVARRSQ